VRHIVAGQFFAVVALLTLWVLLEKFLGAQSSLVFAVLGMPLLALSTLAVIVWAAWGIRRRKVVVLVLAVIADVCFVSGTPTLTRAGDRLFFESRRSRLETFSRDIVAYGRIRQMSDGTRSFTELNGEVVSSGNARSLYWTMPQQLAHATSNGATLRTGDLMASGTISGSEPGSEGSLIELWRNSRFLDDGDEVVLRGRAGAVGLGEVRGRIRSSRTHT